MFTKWYVFWKGKDLKLGRCGYLGLGCAPCEYMCAQMCKCVWKCMWTWACGGQKLALSVFLHKLLYTIYVKAGSLTWTQNFLMQSISLAYFLGGSDLCLLCTGATGSSHAHLKFKCAHPHAWMAGTYPRSLDSCSGVKGYQAGLKAVIVSISTSQRSIRTSQSQTWGNFQVYHVCCPCCAFYCWREESKDGKTVKFCVC